MNINMFHYFMTMRNDSMMGDIFCLLTQANNKATTKLAHYNTTVIVEFWSFYQIGCFFAVFCALHLFKKKSKKMIILIVFFVRNTCSKFNLCSL